MSRSVEIVLVDDDEFFLELVRRELTRALPPGLDWNLGVATSYDEALERVHNAPIAHGLVVASDHDLGPGPTGADVLLSVRRSRPDAVRLLMSGSPEERLRGVIRACEPDAFIEKPLRLESMAHELARWTGIAGTRPPVKRAAARSPAAIKPPISIAVKNGDDSSDSAARERLELYRLLVQNVKDYAIFMIDPNGYVLNWNEGAQRIKGFRSDEIVGQHFSAFYTEPDRRRGHPARELELALKNGRFEEEGWRVRKDGTLFWADVVITPVLAGDGELRGFAKVTRDLTQRRRAEENLRNHAADLSTLMDELDAFNHTVAHDLRAPLRAIIGYATLLRTEMSTSKDAQSALASLQRNAARMGELIEDLLDFSRSTSGSVRRTPLDLTDLVHRAVATVQAREPERKVDVRVAKGLRAPGDEGMLMIVVENLLGNAFKFTRTQTNPRIQVGMESQAGQPVFFVRDNGVGFDPARASELFRPFHRLHASTFEGTGIGLATVRRIVARHGGRVWAEGRPGQGATFYFTLAGTGAVRPTVTSAAMEPGRPSSAGAAGTMVRPLVPG